MAFEANIYWLIGSMICYFSTFKVLRISFLQEHWAEDLIRRLGTSPMNSRRTELLTMIGDRAVQQFWREAFEGKTYGSRHLHRVHRIARHLWEKEGGDEFLILAAAWVHDVSLAEGDDSNSAKVEAFTMGFLREFDALSEEEIRMIAQCVGAHEAGGRI